MPRQPAVWIRKSTDGQEEEGQIANVRKMLEQRGVVVSNDYWFVGTESRATVDRNEQHMKLMSLVEADKMSAVYVESASRWGTTDNAQFYRLIEVFRDHETNLIDLSTGRDLTDGDVATEVVNTLNTFTNRETLAGIAQQSLRSKISHFQATGSWPTGPHPFGYGKACYRPDGSLKWVFQPSKRTRGVVQYVGEDGELGSPSAETLIPRKEKTDVNKLVLGDPEHVASVRLVFDLFVKRGLSRRAISKELNQAGRKHYDKEFSPSIVKTILDNPAYLGHTHYGRTEASKFATFGADGIPRQHHQRMKRGQTRPDKRVRPEEERLVIENTHDPIIERDIWDKAQQRIADEATKKTNHGSRNPAYWLKGLLYCGHCGEQMVGRTDKLESGDVVFYVCNSYQRGKINGTDHGCGYHRVNHDRALELIEDALAAHSVRIEELAGATGQDIEERIKVMFGGLKEERRKIAATIEESIDAFVKYADGPFADMSPEDRRSARHFFEGADSLDCEDISNEEWEELASAVTRAERAARLAASQELEQVEAKFQDATRRWALASDEQEQTFKGLCDELEGRLKELRDRAKPIEERLQAFYDAEHEQLMRIRDARIDLREAPGREKGEALKRVVEKVTLKWDKTWHEALANPKRKRKTDRPGRWSYELLTDAITYDFRGPDLEEDR